MKKNILPGILAILLVTLFSSCGSSIESDAKKVAALTCKAQKMSMKDLMSKDGDVVKEAQQMMTELQAKYTDATERKKFLEAYSEEIKKCR